MITLCSSRMVYHRYKEREPHMIFTITNLSVGVGWGGGQLECVCVCGVSGGGGGGGGGGGYSVANDKCICPWDTQHSKSVYPAFLYHPVYCLEQNI